MRFQFTKDIIIKQFEDIKIYGIKELFRKFILLFRLLIKIPTKLWSTIIQRKFLGLHAGTYSDLLNKRAHPNKRAGRDNFFIYYMKNRVQGGKICHLLHEKLLQGGFFFQKC